MTVVVKSWKVILLFESIVTHGMAHEWLTTMLCERTSMKIDFYNDIFYLYIFYRMHFAFYTYKKHNNLWKQFKGYFSFPFSTFPLYSFFHMHHSPLMIRRALLKVVSRYPSFIISAHLHFPFFNAKSLELRQGINIFNAASSIHKLEKHKMTEIEK